MPGLESEEKLNEVFDLLGKLLVRRTQDHFSLVICGGAALVSLQLISRVTQDVDVCARIEGDKLISAIPFPEVLVETSKIVARDKQLPENWLNPGPASILKKSLPNMGLPEGFQHRLTRRDFGSCLSIYFISRYDQIHLKFYAAADQDRGSRHFTDLIGLNPADDELEAAAKWALLHDSSEGFLATIRSMLLSMGKENVVSRIP